MFLLRINGQIRSLDRLLTGILVLVTIAFLTILTDHAIERENIFQQATLQQAREAYTSTPAPLITTERVSP